MNEIVIFGLSVIFIYGLAAYKNIISSLIGTLCINTIYWYSYAEIYIKKYITNYVSMLDIDNSNNNCTLYYIKHGKSEPVYEKPKHKQPIPKLEENTDALIYTTPTLNVIVLHDSHHKTFDLHKIKSDIEFINITVVFKNEDKTYDISLRSDTSNFYAVGNNINKYIIWSLILEQHVVDRYGCDYNLQLIDHNANIEQYNQNTEIIIHKNGYYIEEQHEHESNDLLCNSPKSLDK